MKKTLVFGGAVVVLLIVGALWSRQLQTRDPSILSRSGLHWHPTLQIYVRGERVDIPKNIGLGSRHKPVHTHDDLPIIHLEFSGIVREKDAMLGRFFESWDRDMRSLGKNVRMTVNGVDNTEYEQYIMRDKDVIELHYD
jgi:hypothetical protein